MTDAPDTAPPHEGAGTQIRGDLDRPIGLAGPNVGRGPPPSTGSAQQRTLGRIDRRSVPSDGALMVRVARHDPEAFGVLYDRHISSAYALAYRTLSSKQSADDVCQEAFLSVWRSAARYDAQLGAVHPWVLAIVRNRAIDHLRRMRRTKEHEVADETTVGDLAAPRDRGTEQMALRHAQADQTRSLLAVLSGDQRRVIELSFYGGYSHTEIADRLGLPLGTAKARMKRGLDGLRAALTAEDRA